MVVVRRAAGLIEPLAFLHQVQAASYAESHDVTDEQVLADIAAQSGLDREIFLQAFRSEEAKQETWRDYAISQRAGVTGFPTLVAGPNAEGVYGAVTRGYSPPEQVLSEIGRASCRERV